MNTPLKNARNLFRLLLIILAGSWVQSSGFTQENSSAKSATDVSEKPDDCFQWAIRAGGNLNGEKVRSLAVGEDGFTYITGQFAGEADFGKETLVSKGKADCFIAKIDADGNFIWVRQIGGEEIERGYGIDADEHGHVFVTGHFQSETINFANTKVTNTGDYDYFTASYDQDGNERWIRTGGGPGYDYGHGLDVMPGGGCVVAGRMIGPISIDETILEKREKVARLFVARYSDDGQLVWAKAGGAPSSAGAEDVAVDREGTVWVSGQAYKNATYHGKPLGQTDQGSLLVAKISGKDGSLIFATRFGGKAEGHVAGVIPDEINGGCYICGAFKGEIGEGSDKVISVGDKDILVARLDKTGKIDWIKTAGGSGWDLALGIGIDAQGNVLVTGFITEKATFGQAKLQISGFKREGFVASYNHQGKLLWLLSNSGTDNEINEDVAADSQGNVIYGGGFQTECIFGKIKLTANSAAKHGQDIFVAKFRPPNAPALTGSVRPGINKKYLDPEMKAEDWVKRFEVESREVYSARNNLLDVLDLKPGMYVADIGAGTGLFTTLFANQVSPKGWVYAVDIALPFVKRLRDIAQENQQKNVTPVLCGEASIRLPDESIEFAFTCDVYHHFEYPQATLKTILSALKPGGRFVVVDFEKIPGVTREWILDHVRADKKTVKKEVEQAGFEFVEEKKIKEFQENYILIFRKPVQ